MQCNITVFMDQPRRANAANPSFLSAWNR